MRDLEELLKNKWLVLFMSVIVMVIFFITSSTYANTYNYYLNKRLNKEIEKSFKYTPSRSFTRTSNGLIPGVTHKRVKRWLHKKPAIVNILIVDPKQSNAIIKPSSASYFLNNIKRVKDIVHYESAIAGVNASYFKPDNGVPLGTSITDGEIETGPLFNRVSLGITKDRQFMIDKVKIDGKISIGDNKLSLFNVNQPVFSDHRFTVFTDKWGMKTPKTSPSYSHVVVIDNMLAYVKNSSVPIPKGGFVIVGPHKLLPKTIKVGDESSYNVKLSPFEWNTVQYAVGGGPYLVKNGEKFIDKQRFSYSFLWTKAPRTAVGYTRSGNLVIVTVDGRIKGTTEGATMSELSQIMYDLGCYDAMNLDGGTSTQMVVNGRIVNYPPVKGGSRVNNALVIIAPVFDYKLGFFDPR